MKIFTFHLVSPSILTAVKTLIYPPCPQQVPGLVHAECMNEMVLGSPIFSPKRLQIRRLAMFAAWESQQAIDSFLDSTHIGEAFRTGWHIRMEFLRRWGTIEEFKELPEVAGEVEPTAPVAAVTLARMKLREVPRFIRWGRPVEELVRDHPGKTFATAAMRLPRTVSTFSIWKTRKEMEEMTYGHSSVQRPERHAVAMKERERKDFHFEFTTLRFKPIGEFGSLRER